MKKTIIFAAASAISTAQASYAQEAGFTWEGEVELGVDATVSSDDPTAEFSDTYISASLAFEAAIAQRLSLFGELTLESVIDAEDNRAFDDIGLYVAELGLRYNFGDTFVSVGKISPVFAVAWDEAPGFYGDALAGDYELSEMIGASVETPVGPGALSFAVFYADDTGLSDSIATKRGRVSVVDGGPGNTGKLDNVALQYTQEFGDTTAWIGARHLSAGDGDISDETGVVAGLTHGFANGFNLITEVAHFNGVGGTDDDATYLTTGLTYTQNVWTFSASTTVIDHSAAPTDSMIALGVDRNLAENIDASFGVARFDVEGEKSTAVGLSAVIAF